MRIGELAGLVGVSTRTIRHYHRLGVLPEPERLPNGYREYRLRDAVMLARVRRLAELGLSLAEIRDVLGEDRGRELREVLAELDADLARQQEAIAARRQRLAALLAEADLHPDSTVSPEMAEVLRDLSPGTSRFAQIDCELLALLDTVTPPKDRERFVALVRSLTEPGALDRSHAFYERLDDLADADPADPRVRALAADLVAHLPPEMLTVMSENLLTELPGPQEKPGPDGRDGTIPVAVPEAEEGSGAPSAPRGERHPAGGVPFPPQQLPDVSARRGFPVNQSRVAPAVAAGRGHPASPGRARRGTGAAHFEPENPEKSVGFENPGNTAGEAALSLDEHPLARSEGQAWFEAVLEGLTPAQAEVFRQVVRIVREQG